jgi:hypothetical protein
MADNKPKNNAKLFDFSKLIEAGIDPKTGLPKKLVSSDIVDLTLYNSIKRQLRILDEQDAINRYVWHNLPSGLDAELIERVLYYRGQGAFFYMEDIEQFIFLPYCLDGSIDCYGRYKRISPLPFNGTNDKGVNNNKGPKPWISGLYKNPVYSMDEDVSEDMFLNGCVLLHDYSKQISETNIPRATLQEDVLSAMAESFPMARTNLMANSGIKAWKVNDEDEQQNVIVASRSVRNSALSGNPYIPVVAKIDLQNLTDGSALKSEEFLLYLQALDNYRLSTYGLDSGGLFQKKAHMLEAEAKQNQGMSTLIYNDGLRIRQNFCNMVNYIWNLNISCEPSEAVVNCDLNGDSVAVDTKDQNGIANESEPMTMEESGDENV